MITTMAQALEHNARVAAGKRRKAGLEPEADPADPGPETRLQGRIRKHCEEQGWLCFTGSTAHRTRRRKGENDHWVLLPFGIVLIVEAKSASGKLSKAQLETRAACARLGHTWHIVNSFAAFLSAADAATFEGKGASLSR